MGLIKSAISAASSSYKDMWKDYFVCDSLQDNVLMVKGIKKGAGLFDKNDVISNGSGIVVADGQCAIVVDDGIVVEVANEPGNYTFDTSKSYAKTYSVISEAAATSINEKYNIIKSNQEMNNDDFEDINTDSKSFTIYEFYKCTSDKTFMISNSKVEVISIEGHNHLIVKKNGSSITCVKGSEEFNTSLDTILVNK